MPSNPINLLVSFPVYFLINSPIRCETGLDGKAFANANVGDKVCVAMFHDDLEAEKFAARFGLRGASICKCVDDQQLVQTLARCKSKFGFKYTGFPTTKEDGSFHIVSIDEFQHAFQL
ncbi:MAG: hypothetical protein ACK506_18680 [Pirellula sp.]|jgi:hypothetical protein